jgi:cell filamentation protein
MTELGRGSPAGGEDAPPVDPNQSPEWLSYLMPGTTVLRTVAELTDRTAVAIFERIVSADAEAKLRQDTDRTRSLDLAHLDDIHTRLFGEVYPFAGQHRYVDTQKPGQTGEPVLHHRWISTYTDAVIAQLRDEGNLASLTDPGQWADRAAYYQAALLHSHPYREGNGRAIRVWLEDLAAEAGHALDWTRSGHDRNNAVAIAAAHGDYEPARALLSVVAGGTTGIDRPVGVLNDLDKYLHAQAWSRTGLVHGTDQEKQVVAGQLRQLDALVVDVASYLRAHHPVRAASVEQPATERWRGLVESVHPSLTRDPHWAGFAAELDVSADAGIDVATELPRLSRAAARPITAPADDDVNPPAATPPVPAFRVAYTPERPAASPPRPAPPAPPMARSGPHR